MKTFLKLFGGLILSVIFFAGIFSFAFATPSYPYCTNGQGDNCHCNNISGISTWPDPWEAGCTDTRTLFCNGSVASVCVSNSGTYYRCTYPTTYYACPVAGSCGSANNTPVSAAPTANLCSAGNATAVSGTGPWTWSCNGTDGGGNVNCSAPVACTYISSVTQWSACSNGVSYASSTAFTTTYVGNPACVDVPVVMSCAAPINLTATCPSPGARGTVSWNSISSSTYAIRINNQSNSWNGLCDGSQNAGDFCTSTSTNVFSFTGIPSAVYNWWVHSIVNGVISSSSVGANFTCDLLTPPTNITGGPGNGSDVNGGISLMPGVSSCGGKTYLKWDNVIGADKYYIYKNDGVPTFGNIKVLVVAGGGGGGGTGGGGGAGGLISSTTYAITNGNTITVIVGNYGSGAIGYSNGSNGGNSNFGSLTANGGGGGNTLGSVGSTGGSGGGGGGVMSGSIKSGGAGSPGQGNAGGYGGINSTGWGGSGGGGGAGGVGANGDNSSNGGAGGAGLYFTQFADVAGSPAGWFASGGGGAEISGGSAGAASNGGGGRANTNAAGSNAAANTGGGGGAGSYSGAYQNGGNGGSGIVIVRYNTADFGNSTTAVGGTKSIIGAETVYLFATSGTITFAPAAATDKLFATTTATSTVLSGTPGTSATYSVKSWSSLTGLSSSSNPVTVSSSAVCDNGVSIRAVHNCGNNMSVTYSVGSDIDPLKWTIIRQKCSTSACTTITASTALGQPAGSPFTDSGLVNSSWYNYKINATSTINAGGVATSSVSNATTSIVCSNSVNCSVVTSPLNTPVLVNKNSIWDVTSATDLTGYSKKWTVDGVNLGISNPLSKIFTTIGQKTVSAYIENVNANGGLGWYGSCSTTTIVTTQSGIKEQ